MGAGARANSPRLLSFALLLALACSLVRLCTYSFVASAPQAQPRLRARETSRLPAALRSASDDTMSKVADIVAEQLGADKAKVIRTATLTELGADSLDIVE